MSHGRLHLINFTISAYSDFRCYFQLSPLFFLIKNKLWCAILLSWFISLLAIRVINKWSIFVVYILCIYKVYSTLVCLVAPTYHRINISYIYTIFAKANDILALWEDPACTLILQLVLLYHLYPSWARGERPII